MNARSAPFSVSSAPALRAASTKRLYCAGSSGLGFDFCSIARRYHDLRSKGSSNWNGAAGSRLRMSSSIREALTLCAFDRNRFALHVIDAQLGAGIHAEIKFVRVTLEMLGVDVLINADDAALEDGKEAFQRVRVNIATRPFKLGMIDGFVNSPNRVLEHRRAIADQSAIPVQVLVQARTDAAMVKHNRADIAAAFYKAQNLHIRPATFGMAARLCRTTNLHIVDFYGLTLTADRAGFVGVHHFADAMAKVPRGFHAAAKHPLKLAGRNAFLGCAKQMDRLQPHPQGKVAILKNRTLAHGKGRTTARVTLAQADLHDAFGVLFGRLGAHVCKSADLVAERSAMRANGTFRPKLGLDVIEGGLLAKEPGIGKDGVGHG